MSFPLLQSPSKSSNCRSPLLASSPEPRLLVISPPFSSSFTGFKLLVFTSKASLSVPLVRSGPAHYITTGSRAFVHLLIIVSFLVILLIFALLQCLQYKYLLLINTFGFAAAWPSSTEFSRPPTWSRRRWWRSSGLSSPCSLAASYTGESSSQTPRWCHQCDRSVTLVCESLSQLLHRRVHLPVHLEFLHGVCAGWSRSCRYRNPLTR